MNDQSPPESKGLIGVASVLRRSRQFPAINNIYKPSDRELEIIDLLSVGCNTKEIAERLKLSTHTISTHRKRIIQKTGAKNTVELVASCIREGII